MTVHCWASWVKLTCLGSRCAGLVCSSGSNVLFCGAWLQVHSSHDAVLTISSPSTPTTLAHKAAAGSSTVCLPGQGDFEVVPESCYHFGQDVFQVEAGGAGGARTVPLELQATKAYVKGNIKVSGVTPAAVIMKG